MSTPINQMTDKQLAAEFKTLPKTSLCRQLVLEEMARRVTVEYQRLYGITA